MKDFDDYFEDTISYPEGIAADILPWNTEWVYVSNTFLNGFINYVKIRKAYILARYQRWESGPIAVQVMEPPGTYEWATFRGSKREVYEVVTQPNRLFHTKLSCLGDDVLVLARIPETENGWMYFWFDMDCSDCCIGRFHTEDPEEEVLRKFHVYCEAVNRENNVTPSAPQEMRELPKHFFQGWISS